MRERNPEGLRALNRRYYHSPAGQASRQRSLQRKREVILAERIRRGNRCLDCGVSNDTLVWHHRDPEAKEFEVGQGIIKSYAALEAELEKCDLLCEDCHAVRHCLPRPSFLRAKKEAKRDAASGAA